MKKDAFINLYKIIKTLNFELKPTVRTFEKLLEKTEKNDFYGQTVETIIEKIKDFDSGYESELVKITSIWELLLNGDKTKIFISPEFLEKLYKYSFDKNNIKEPKKLSKKIQRLTIEGINNYLLNFQNSNLKEYKEALIELDTVVKNYENGIGKENTEMPKKVEIFQLIRKVSNIDLKTLEILSQLETTISLRDEYNKGREVAFLPKLKSQLEALLRNSEFKEDAKKYLRTLTGERGIGIGSFSLNKYAVNNFKEICIIKEKLFKLEKDYDLKKQKKFKDLQIREKAYWEAWNEMVEQDKYFSILKNQCPAKGKQKDIYKMKNKEIKKKIYNEKIKTEADNYKKSSNFFGDIEKKRISLQRELEEVSDSKYFARIIKESNDIFYLALTERLDESNKKKRLDELDVLQNNFSKDGELQVLDFYKISFSAFEKLCLLQNSTLGITDKNEEQNVKGLWEGIKYKRFESEDNQEKLKKIIEYTEKIITQNSHLFIADFDFEVLKKSQDFKDFEKNFNAQGYKISYKNIAKERLLELEKNGEILLFQIFCKDFVLDENFALTNFDKKRVGFNSTGKDNLHTRYFKEFFQNIENKDFWKKWRLFGEGKLQFREKDETPNISRRYKDDKFFVSLPFQINPNTIDVKKEVKYDEKFQQKHINSLNTKIKEEFKPRYVIGLDQGVNSLVSYCVIDSKENIVRDENEKVEIGDLSLVISNGENQGEFVEVEETIIQSAQKGTWNSEKEILEQEEVNSRVLKNDNDIKVFDYAEAIYVESYKRQQEVVNYKEGDEVDFDEISSLKKGYASYVVHKIEELAKKYSPAIISLEYMQDTKDNSNFVSDENKKKNERRILKGKDILTVQSCKNEKGKTKNYTNPKTYRFGTSTVEVLEEALLNKFGYWNGKVENSEMQLSPCIVERTRIYEKDIQWGNILFIDETNTSIRCPKCGEKTERCRNPLDKTEWKKAKILSDDLVNSIYGELRRVEDIIMHDPKDQGKCNWRTTDENRTTFSEIRNGDDLASYNIARRGFNLIINNKKNEKGK